jgi:hypothetical protein
LSIALVTTAGVSFRAVSKIFIHVNLYLHLNLKIPTHTTVLNWTKKQGIGQFRDKEFYQNEKWVLIVDESIRFGNKKLLLILAVPEHRCTQGTVLTYKDVRPLVLKVSSSWKSIDIIPEINEQIDLKQIAYCVSDGGNNLVATFKSLGCTHIYDITHKISLIIQSVFEKNRLFKKYTKALSLLRTKKSMTNIARIVPNNQRVMSRFMNLTPLFDWGIKMINLLEQNQLSADEQTALSFLNRRMRKFVLDTYHILTVLNNVQKSLKNQGFNEDSKKEAKLLFSSFKSEISLKISKLLDEYFADLTSKAKEKTICCSSDIIESCLGKYKEIAKGNKSVGISDLCLCIASIIGGSSYETTKEAIETVSTKDVKEWKKKNVSKTLFAEIRELNKKVERKYYKI